MAPGAGGPLRLGRTALEDAACLLLALGLFAMAMGWLRSATLKGRGALGGARALLRRIGRTLSAPSHDVDCLIRDRMMEIRAQHFRTLLAVLGTLNGVMSLFLLSNILGHHFGVPPVFLPDCGTALHVLSQTYFAFSATVPNFVRAETLDFHYACVMLLLAAAASPLAEPPLPLVLLHTLLVVALAVTRGTTGRHRFPVFFACNACFAASASLRLRALGSGCLSGPVPPWFWFALELLGVPACCCGVQVLEEHLHATMRQCLQLEEVREVHLAACALLRSCCEVVVELDAERRIVSPEPDLGSYLMLGAGSLEGTRLEDLIPDEDGRVALGEALARPLQAGLNLAEAIQVHLRDGWNNPLRAELLWFRFRRLDGAQHFMVGIRDFGEHAPQRSAQEQRREAIPAVQGESDSQETPRSSSGPGFAEGSGEAVAIVDCEQPGYPVVSLSPGFAAHIGRLPVGEPLLNHVIRSQRVLLWVQEALNLFFNGEEPPQCRITFRTPSGPMATSCHILASPSVDFDMRRVCLAFAWDLPGLMAVHSSSSSADGGPAGRRAAAGGPVLASL